MRVAHGTIRATIVGSNRRYSGRDESHSRIAQAQGDGRDIDHGEDGEDQASGLCRALRVIKRYAQMATKPMAAFRPMTGADESGCEEERNAIEHRRGHDQGHALASRIEQPSPLRHPESSRTGHREVVRCTNGLETDPRARGDRCGLGDQLHAQLRLAGQQGNVRRAARRACGAKCPPPRSRRPLQLTDGWSRGRSVRGAAEACCMA